MRARWTMFLECGPLFDVAQFSLGFIILVLSNFMTGVIAMEALHLPRAMLEYLTLKLRHAVSTGEYITVEMLESALDDYRKSVKE